MRGLRVLGGHPVDLGDLRRAAEAEHLGREGLGVDADRDLRVLLQRLHAVGGVATCGAEMKVGITSSSPVHTNQLATIRGVPSCAV